MNLNPVDNYLHGSWEALGNGAPTLVALAQLCSERWAKGASGEEPSIDALSDESLAILFAAKDHGVIEIRGVSTAFEAAGRMLAVYVEVSEERTIAFRDKSHPETTAEFLQGFRELCDLGLVIHHIHRDFSLSPAGWKLARAIEADRVEAALGKATEFGLHD